MSLRCGHFFPGEENPACVYCGLWLRVPAYRAKAVGSPAHERKPIGSRFVVSCPMLGERLGGTPCTTPLHHCYADDTVCSTAAPCLDAVRWCGACPLRPEV
jgi:hypothetical protein